MARLSTNSSRSSPRWAALRTCVLVAACAIAAPGFCINSWRSSTGCRSRRFHPASRSAYGRRAPKNAWVAKNEFGSGPARLLGVSPTASKDEIRKRYRELVLVEHPDKKPGDPEAPERFRKLTEAYRELLANARSNGASGRTGGDGIDWDDSKFDDLDFGWGEPDKKARAARQEYDVEDYKDDDTARPDSLDAEYERMKKKGTRPLKDTGLNTLVLIGAVANFALTAVVLLSGPPVPPPWVEGGPPYQ